MLPRQGSSTPGIDATLMPLAPGKLLVNAERLPKIPEIFLPAGGATR
jgi:hypothetical protein